MCDLNKISALNKVIHKNASFSSYIIMLSNQCFYNNQIQKGEKGKLKFEEKV